jgi:spermidine synthase
MKPWVTLQSAKTSKGTSLSLQQRGDEFVIRAGGQVLMTSRNHASEDALAKAAFEKPARMPRDVLLGGLGMGFSLRAALEKLSAEAQITVAELVPEVVEWNRGPLARLANSPLSDARVKVALGDVRLALRPQVFDSILLDVDNGPAALTQKANAALYGPSGLAELHRALRPGGRLALWSAGPAPEFVASLQRARFSVQVHPAGGRHVIFTADRKPI